MHRLLLKTLMVGIFIAMNTTPILHLQQADHADWKTVTDVQDVVAAYPDRIDALMEALDLDREGLGPVRDALNKGDRAAACTRLCSSPAVPLATTSRGFSRHWS